MKKLAIRVEGLQKKYSNNKVAVKGISFEVEQGSLFAFLGTNGAGKSTTIEILCTLLKKTEGKVFINNYQLDNKKNNDEIRKSIGVVFQKSFLDANLTVYENIIHRGKIYNLSKKQLEENYIFVSKYLNLKDIETEKYGNLSGGQKRRADIARALIHRPQILFLDEPTTGLDPQTRQFVWEIIGKLQKETGMTVFLTTHYMEEAAVANQIVVLKAGEIVAQGTPDNLKTKYAYDQVEIIFSDVIEGEKWLRNNAADYTENLGIYSIKVESTLHALTILNKIKPILRSFEVIKGSMDDVFIHIMNKKEEIT